MSRPYLLISFAWLLQVAAWFLPVIKKVQFVGNVSLPGWAAFSMACRAVCSGWSGEDTLFTTWYETVLAAMSVVVTVLFIVGSALAVLRGSRLLRRASAWAAAMAFLVNAHWFVLRVDGWVSGLGIGYFAWWWSFGLLAMGLFDLAGRNSATESTQARAALLPR